MRAAALACCLLALPGALPGTAAWAEVDPRYQPKDQPGVVPAQPGAFGPTISRRREPLVPIELDRRAEDPDFVQKRCAGLVWAVTIRSPMEMSNPLTGFDRTRGEPLLWATTVDLKTSFPQLSTDEHEYTRDYSSAFGPLTKKQTFLELPLYLRDKAHCLPLLKYYGQ